MKRRPGRWSTAVRGTSGTFSLFDALPGLASSRPPPKRPRVGAGCGSGGVVSASGGGGGTGGGDGDATASTSSSSSSASCALCSSVYNSKFLLFSFQVQGD